MKKLQLLILPLSVLALVLGSSGASAQNKLCNQLEAEIDELRETTRILSPVLEPVCFYKVKDKDTTITYIILKADGGSISLDAKGVILLFSDGTRWEKPDAPAKAKVKDLGVYQYKALIPLTNDEIDLFSKKTIKKFGVYIYDTAIKQKDAEKYVVYAECIKGK